MLLLLLKKTVPELPHQNDDNLHVYHGVITNGFLDDRPRDRLGAFTGAKEGLDRGGRGCRKLGRNVLAEAVEMDSVFTPKRNDGRVARIAARRCRSAHVFALKTYEASP